GVAEVAAAADRLGVADEGGDPLDRTCQLLDRALVGGDEVGLQVEVLGRVAGDAELGEDHQLGAGLAGTADPLGDLGRGGVDIAKGGVGLGEGDAHRSREVSPPRPTGRRPTLIRDFLPATHRVPRVRDPRRLVLGISAAALLALAATPAAAVASEGLAEAV